MRVLFPGIEDHPVLKEIEVRLRKDSHATRVDVASSDFIHNNLSPEKVKADEPAILETLAFPSYAWCGPQQRGALRGSVAITCVPAGESVA